MVQTFKKFISKHANALCLLAAVIAPISGRCWCKFYQPAEPENLMDLVEFRK